MEGDELASLHAYVAAIPLNVRVLRKWKPAGRTSETCFLLIDKQGVAVQAVLQGVNNAMLKQDCPWDHAIELKITAVTNNTEIKLTLWEEICTKLTRYNKPAIQTAAEPRIIAATSVKVRRFMHQVKLQSSAATYVYLNPLTVQSSQLLELYQSGKQADTPAYHNSVENAKATIKELTLKPGKQINGHTFIITGHIALIPHQTWCHNACEECNKDVIEAGPKCYRVNGVIRDETGTINATIYDEVIVDMMGFKCSEIAEGNNTLELNRSTALLEPIIGRQTNFQVIPTKNDRSGAIRCTIHRCLPIQIEHNHHLAAITTHAPVTPQQTATTEKQLPHSLAKRQVMLDVAGDNPKEQEADNKGKTIASNPVEVETQLEKKSNNNKTNSLNSGSISKIRQDHTSRKSGKEQKAKACGGRHNYNSTQHLQDSSTTT
ncbi:hypothetical protein QVD17_42280 [Tagetes erecta]|uniref:Uncharacterized protein n=1 Tax=Tagetes erecta TaxID=13708 RepID=A0AAD8NFH8_TARER|nr:hypothetical protein QVD17_42280 [Tagetes erecta]